MEAPRDGSHEPLRTLPDSVSHRPGRGCACPLSRGSSGVSALLAAEASRPLLQPVRAPRAARDERVRRPATRLLPSRAFARPFEQRTDNAAPLAAELPTG